MQIQTRILTPYTIPLNKNRLIPSKTLAFSGTPPANKPWIHGGNLCNLPNKGRRAVVSAIEEGNLSTDVQRARKIVEHLCLLKAKENLSEEEENDMLDYLYTTQYQMRGILAISLGRICDENPEQYTHAIFMRFQTKEDLAKFYENPFYMGVLKEHVMPNCHGVFNFDYESEVEDDILPIFRKGEEYNYGLELILLVAFIKSSLGGLAEDAMTSLAKLTLEFPSLIVQATKGTNINMSSTEYTHGVVIRFRSSEAFKIFMSSSEYNTWVRSTWSLAIRYSVTRFIVPVSRFHRSWCSNYIP
ncbi:hypothetical protein ACJIZ3_008255 [Penstemon smallii]|uniref:Stress-response A/B barrel domain-containing protein n=1 Tax=Penstemon smallii TaxID=265156 RepID=A0ABD3T9B3_9LAMI